jgi:nucleoid DNA-binding protein
MIMNKNELIETVQSVLETKKQAEMAINSILSNIEGALKKGDTVTLTGFGTFKVAKRKARTGRNPQTGETIKIKASKTVSFKAGKKLRESLQ